MKPVVEWDETYVLSLSSGEFDSIEFKGAKALDVLLPNVKESEVRNELSKQISAFSNSGGGTIVYGILNPKDGVPLEIDGGGVSLYCKNNTKEWLEDIIPNLTDFPISRFNVFAIVGKTTSSSIASGKAVFAINIPGSDQAPHQSNIDKKYYARVGGKSRPIGHRMVADIFGRRRDPQLRVDFWVQKQTDRDEIPIRAECRNVGKVLARFVSGEILIPATINADPNFPIVVKNDHRYRLIKFSNLKREGGGMGAPFERHEPILPGLSFPLHLATNMTSIQQFHHAGDSIFWSVFADSAVRQSGEICFSDLRSSKPENDWYTVR